jgi:hypothetical protein
MIAAINIAVAQAGAASRSLPSEGESASYSFTAAPETYFAAPPPETSDQDTLSSHARFNLQLGFDNEWNELKEHRYSELAVLKATGKAQAEHSEEFASLLDLRRRTKTPVSVDEMVFQHRRRKIERELLKQLNRYAIFLKTARRS